MFYEYALEPELLNNWKDFRYFYENFGISEGRLISRYPKHWKRLVYESLSGCDDMDRKRIVEKLKQIDNKLIARSHQWNQAQDWLANAQAEHQRNPFHAIVASRDSSSNDKVLIGDHLDEENPLWKPETQADVARNASSMADSIATLLRLSCKLIFIDPHFGPEKRDHCQTLRAFLDVAMQSRIVVLTRVEYHLKEKSTCKFFSQECQKRLPSLIPEGVDVLFKRWCEKQGGDKLHDRFILTDLGGVEFTVGLDQGRAGEETKVHILLEDTYLNTWNKFLSDSPAYDLVDEVNVLGSRKINR